jgi:GPH family glycoside/pentoside/hexuronide:cation symporter
MRPVSVSHHAIAGRDAHGMTTFVDREPSATSLIFYALPALPLAILTLPFYVVVPAFYAQAGLPIALVGQTLLVVRIADALSDPLAGILADRFRPRFGRRRTWVLATTPIVALAAVALFMPPREVSAVYLGLWGALLSISWTACLVPYMAWGAELSRSYAGRTRVVAFREAMTVTGTLFALLIAALLPALGFDGPRAVLTTFAIIVAAGLPLAALMAVAGVPEPVERTRRRLNLRQGLAHMARNRPFLRLLAAFFVNGLANGLPAALFLFFVADRLGAPDAAGLLLVVYFVCGILGVPMWFLLARRTSKHRAWAVGMILATAAFAAAPFLGKGDVVPFAIVCMLTGFALGADVILPPAIQADVIDLDTARSGEERSGLYFAVWALATKLALALAVGVAFPILGAFGFDPASGLKSAVGLTTLGLLYAGVPVLLKALAIVLMWRFPLDAWAVAEVAIGMPPARSPSP